MHAFLLKKEDHHGNINEMIILDCLLITVAGTEMRDTLIYGATETVAGLAVFAGG